MAKGFPRKAVDSLRDENVFIRSLVIKMGTASRTPARSLKIIYSTIILIFGI
jgi:hypothetical protein